MAWTRGLYWVAFVMAASLGAWAQAPTPQVWLHWAESPQLYHSAQGWLAAAAGFDAIETIYGMSRPPILHLTRPGPNPPPYTDLNFRGDFAEGGWAKVAGRHNVLGVVSLNLAADALVALAAHQLARHGPRWRLVASAMLVAQGCAHLQGGGSWIGLRQRLAAPYAPFNPVWQR